MKYFVFVDESGTGLKDQYFGLGCLIVPFNKIGDYGIMLQKKYDQIYTMMKKNESKIMKNLDGEQNKQFLIGRNKPYEMKFKNINQTTLKGYFWLLSQYFKFTDIRFSILVVNKNKYKFPNGTKYYDVYLDLLTELLNTNFSENDEFVVLPDSITSPRGKIYETDLLKNLTNAGKKCFGICRLDSRSNLFIQMVDCLIGAVLFDYKDLGNKSKKEFLEKLKQKTGITSFKNSIIIKNPNHFSIYNY